jgi:hypothetical protein
MLGRCPCCGTSGSLELFIGDDDVAKAIAAALSITPVGKQVVRYLGLFRPEKKTLAMPKVAKLLAELMPMIERQEAKRGGVVFAAPHEVWALAIEKVIEARDLGKLQTPLKTHGYLLEVVITESSKQQLQGVEMVGHSVGTISKPLSATAQAVMALEARKGVACVAG